MKKMIALLPLAALALTGCIKMELDIDGDREIVHKYVGTETFSVASEKGIYLSVIGGHYPCTMLRKSGSESWFAQPVIGFDEYEQGYEYVIMADRYHSIVPKGMTVDGPLHSYRLREVVSMVRRDTRDISWFMPCYDIWPGKPGEWPLVPHGELKIIRTVEEFTAFAGPMHESMRGFFDRYSLLLASGPSNYGTGKINKRLTYRGGGNYLFEVEVTNTIATVAIPWSVAVAVPAIPSGAQVRLEVR